MSRFMRAWGMGFVVGFGLLTGAATGATVTWDGTGDMNWGPVPDATSWTGGTYNNGDTANFAGSGAGVVIIDAAGVSPGAVNVTGGSYTFTNGAISGSGAFASSGTGILIVHGTNNTYTGKTSLSAAAGNPTWQFTKLADAGLASSFGAPLAGANAIIDLGGNGSSGGLQYIGATDSTTDRALNLVNGSGGNYFFKMGAANATVTLKFTSDFTSTWTTAGARTLWFDRYSVSPKQGKIWIAGKLADANTGAGRLLNVSLDDNENSDFVTLTGLSTYSGSTYVGRNAWLTISTIKNLGEPSAIGAPTTIANGTLTFGENGSQTLRYIGTGDTSERVIFLKPNGTDRGVILDQSGAGLLTFTSNLRVEGTANAKLTLQGSTAGIGEIAGGISNATSYTTSLTKAGTGAWILSAVNTYTGATTVNGGVLRLSNASALGSGNLSLGGSGVVELGAGDLTRGVGTGAGQVQIRANESSGFSAYGANRIVNLGGVGASVTWPWGTGTLILGSAAANARIDFQNAIDLNGSSRTIQVNDNPASSADEALLSGNLTSTYGYFTKAGSGLLILSGNNTYGFAASVNPTTVNAGVLRLASATALSVNTTLVLNGGVCELGAGDMTRALSTDSAGAEVRFTGSGGFSAYGANRSVNLGGNVTPSTVTWNTGGFVPTGSILIMNSAVADAQIEFKNPINLNGATQTIQVDDNTGSTADLALFSGLISSGSLTKAGAGTLILSNGGNTYTDTAVNAGALRVTGKAGTGTATVASGGTIAGTGTVPALVVSSGGTLAVYDTGSGPSQLTVSGALTITGATLDATAAGTLNSASNYVIATCASRTGTFAVTNGLPVTHGVEYTATNITLVRLNQAPTDIALSAASVAENQSVGTAVGTLSSTDPDAGATFTYTLVPGTGDTDNGSFTIDGDTLKTAALFDYETKSSYSIRIRTTDQGSLYYEEVFTITVANVNEAPTDIMLSASSVAENEPVGTSIGTLSSSDPDAGNTFTYTLVAGVGGTDNASFAIDGNTLKTAASLSYEPQSNYSVRVRSTDQGGLFVEEAFTVTVTDVVEPPVMKAAASVQVGTASPVGTVQATNPENRTLVYSITGGQDAALFNLGAASGILTFNTPPPGGVGAKYYVEVAASDDRPVPSVARLFIEVTVVASPITGTIYVFR